MKTLFRFVLLLALGISSSAQEEGDTSRPDVVEFAKSIEGLKWTLRGTYSLKAVQFDGVGMRNFAPDGTLGGRYDTIFPDRNLVRILFKDDTSAWYFFDDERKWLASTKVLSERVFALDEGKEAKPVENFPEDVLGQVFVSTDDGPDRRPGKFRWNGDKMEFAALHGDRWKSEEMPVFVARDRVFEAKASEDIVIWFVFGSDGREVWFLQVENIFGGHRADAPGKSDMPREVSGLSSEQNDLANHLIDLVEAGVKEPAWTLMRQFERKLGDKNELLEDLKRRINAR